MKAKKFCIIALVLAIVLFIAPISESRAEEEPEVKVSGDYEYYILDDGTACIKKYNGNDEKVTIPDKLDEKKVTGIGDGAFSSCENLTEVTIPDSVENIGINPFSECENLLNINISANHPTLFFLDNVIFYKPEKRLVSYLSASEEKKYEIPKGIKIIGDSAFSGCKNLEEINIPNSVQSIGKRAFFGCTNLTEIKIPDSVQSIGDSAFSACINLTEIKIPDGVQSIGDSVFSFSINLTEIKIPDSLENIGINPFDGCTNLLKINISDNHHTLEFVDNALIYKPEKRLVTYLRTSNKTKYEIPKGIKIIGDGAFTFCNNLTEIKIPDSVETIRNLVFTGCNNLTEINIPDSVQSIGNWVFNGCDNLKKIKIPASVKTIKDDAFYGSNNLTIIVEKGSFVEEYCKENNIKYMYEDSLNWLKN